MKIQESAENYLEAILILSRQQDQVRSVDVAGYTGFSKPSISIAMKHLREAGYITMDANGAICLLPPGQQIAEKIYERHYIISRAFMALGVSPETALADACKIEHVISDESFHCMKAHFLQIAPPSDT